MKHQVEQNHALTAFAMMYAEDFQDFVAAWNRVGHETVAYMVFGLAEATRRSQPVHANYLAAWWDSAKIDDPVDHGLIDVMVKMNERMSESQFLRKRVIRQMKLAGIYPHA